MRSSAVTTRDVPGIASNRAVISFSRPATVFAKMRSKPLTVPGGVLGIPGTNDQIPALKLQVKPKYKGNLSIGFTAQLPPGVPR